MHRRGSVLVVTFCLLVAFATDTFAEQEVVVEVAPKQNMPGPSGENIISLVRSTLLTLNDALQTGNFTVLRDRGAAGFRQANSAARLSQVFSDLLSRGVDLSVVSIAPPQLTQSPTLNEEQGTLFITGYVPAPPTRIDFELLYERAGNGWQLFGLSVQVPEASAAAQKSPETAPVPRPNESRKPKAKR